MKPVLYISNGSTHSTAVAHALSVGFKRHNIQAKTENRFNGIRGDIAIAYGWVCEDIFNAYKADGKRFLFLDLGYWKRIHPSYNQEGYYRIALDSWCPVPSMRRNCPSDRFNNLRIKLYDVSNKENVIVAGMSAKSAKTHGFEPNEWEQNTINKLLKITNRRIIYRPKPSWMGAKPLSGADYNQAGDIETVLANANILVTHHSNSAVDAVVAGISVYSESNVGMLMSQDRLEDIEMPRCYTEEERHQFLADVAYCQWNLTEMRNGDCWEHIREILNENSI